MVTIGVPSSFIQGSILIFINDLFEGLSSNAKLFWDDTSLFSPIHNSQTFSMEKEH